MIICPKKMQTNNLIKYTYKVDCIWLQPYVLLVSEYPGTAFGLSRISASILVWINDT